MLSSAGPDVDGTNTASPGRPVSPLTEPVLDGVAGGQVVAHQAVVADGHRVAGGQSGQPVVDARELHGAVVELAFGDGAVCRSIVQLHITPSASKPPLLPPQFGIPNRLQHN